MGGTAYIDRQDAELRLDGRALALYVNGVREGTIPLVPLDRLVLVGNVTVPANVLHRCCEDGVSVVLLSGRQQRYRGRLVGRLHRHARVRVRQYAARTGPLALELAREWVSRKLREQDRFLREAADERPVLRTPLLQGADVVAAALAKVAEAAAIESLRGVEGAAAAAYFGALTTLFPESLGFEGRERRPPRDPVNALLSLTYTLVHGEWVRECELIGLDPLVGFYHDLDYGRESLACDLMEPTRPAVDRWVWERFRTRDFQERDFTWETHRPGCSLKKGARSRYYEAYEDWIRPHRAAMRAEVEALARRLTDGEDTVSVGEPDAPGEA